MRICIIGEYSPIRDEGMRKVTFHLAQELFRSHQVLRLDIKTVFTSTFWREVKCFGPQIIHYIHGPTIKSFLLMKILSLYCRNAKTVMSAMRPYFSLLSARFIPLFKPDLILTQSQETEGKLRSLGCWTEFLPCGVDIKKFAPVTPKIKRKLRRKYGIDNDKFVLLHVGSIKPGRGVQMLVKLQKKGTQMIIVGPTSVGINKEMFQGLKEAGCLVWTGYFEKIEEIYALADCYIYPTMPLKDALGRAISDSIELPLSVLEAMSCNLPVISTRFGALPRVFKQGNGLFFAERLEDFKKALQDIKYGRIEIRTRQKVLSYSWQNITRKVEEIYKDLLGDEN